MKLFGMTSITTIQLQVHDDINNTAYAKSILRMVGSDLATFSSQ